MIEISEYRTDLYDYLKNRMMAIAPNLTVMVGELVGARLIAHAGETCLLVRPCACDTRLSLVGSLLNLAKHPSSTVQILGAEKALFRCETLAAILVGLMDRLFVVFPRALKTKHDTPKYGLIFHASLVGQSAPKHKGKISRMLAAKTSLAVRVDALGEDVKPSLAIEARAKVLPRSCERDRGLSSLFGPGGSKT